MFGRKIKLSAEQHNVVTGIASELNIPKEEVLWVFVELGQGLAIFSQENEDLRKEISKRKSLPGYEHCEDIARLLYKFWKAGEEKHKQ